MAEGDAKAKDDRTRRCRVRLFLVKLDAVIFILNKSRFVGVGCLCCSSWFHFCIDDLKVVLKKEMSLRENTFTLKLNLFLKDMTTLTP